MARIAVIGAGAVGGTVAAWLAREHEIALCVRTPLQNLAVDTPLVPLHAEPAILTDTAGAWPADWILAVTKTYDSDAAARWLPGLMGRGTRVAILQNGVEHCERFRGKVADEALLPCIVDIPAERFAPGRVLQRRTGSILVPEGEAGRAFVALFGQTPIAVSTTDDFTTAAWRKLAINCAGIVNAIALRPAELANDPGVAEVMRGLVRECVTVGRAEGADLPDTLPDDIVEHYRAADPQSLNSLHADRLASRAMEIDARNGVIVRLGEKHGIDAPLNRALAVLLAAAR